MARIFVTGGAGFIGSAFVRHLLATSDDHITVFDALTYAGRRENLDPLLDDPRVTFIVGDVANRDEVRGAIGGHDYVAHLAAESHVDRSLLDPDVFIRTNCVGTNVMCDEANRGGVQRFLHVSTDEVYGSITTGAFSEQDPLTPSSPYSASKASSDLIAFSHHTSNDLDVVVTRSSNQFGPRQFPEKLIPLFITTLVGGGNVPVYGDGTNVRDWLFVEDNCAALDAVMRNGETATIYNIAGHNERTNLEVVDALLECMGLDHSRIEFVPDRPGHDYRYAITTTRTNNLNIPAPRAFEPALEQTVRWYLDNKQWWAPLTTLVRNR